MFASYIHTHVEPIFLFVLSEFGPIIPETEATVHGREAAYFQ